MDTQPFDTEEMTQRQQLREILISFAGTGWQSSGVPSRILMGNMAPLKMNPSRETMARWLREDEEAGLVEKVGDGRYRATPALLQGARKYDYEFQVHANDRANGALLMLCSVMAGRLVMEMTEAEFTAFRWGLTIHGLELREITRTPHAEPETVP